MRFDTQVPTRNEKGERIRLPTEVQRFSPTWAESRSQ